MFCGLKKVCEHMFCGLTKASVCEHILCGLKQVYEHMLCGLRQVCEHMVCVEEKFLSLDPISSATVRRVIYYLTSEKMKGWRKCWKIKMKRKRKVKLMKRSKKSERNAQLMHATW